MAMEKVLAIFGGWAENDERWKALIQVIGEYIDQVTLQAEVCADNRQLAHANGGYLALVNCTRRCGSCGSRSRRKGPEERKGAKGPDVITLPTECE